MVGRRVETGQKAATIRGCRFLLGSRDGSGRVRHRRERRRAEVEFRWPCSLRGRVSIGHKKRVSFKGTGYHVARTLPRGAGHDQEDKTSNSLCLTFSIWKTPGTRGISEEQRRQAPRPAVLASEAPLELASGRAALGVDLVAFAQPGQREAAVGFAPLSRPLTIAAWLLWAEGGPNPPLRRESGPRRLGRRKLRPYDVSVGKSPKIIPAWPERIPPVPVVIASLRSERGYSVNFYDTNPARSSKPRRRQFEQYDHKNLLRSGGRANHRQTGL